MIDLIGGVLILIGAGFSLIAGIGLVRLPDLYLRMHAATKAGTLGAGLVLLAIMLEAGRLEIAVRAVTGLVFLFFTAPLAAHLLGRAGYLAGVPLWDRTIQDDLTGQYGEQTKRLQGYTQPDAPLTDVVSNPAQDAD